MALAVIATATIAVAAWQAKTPLRSIDYEGLTVPKPVILRRMEQIGLGVMRPYDQEKVDEAKDAIQDIYKQRGILVNVDVKELPIPPDSIALTFVISKR